MGMNKSEVRGCEIEEALVEMRDEAQRVHLMRFFKTGKGEYGEGDEFLGLKVPLTRAVVKEARGLVGLHEIEGLLYSPFHEVRLAGFLLIVEEMKLALPRKRDKLTESKAGRRKELTDFYLKHARQANNWDLVDLSCEYIVGYFLLYSEVPDYYILHRLAESENLWEKRIAIVSTLTLIRNGIFGPTLEIADKLLVDPHDLLHKAVGWMLREIGKKDKEVLLDYLESNYCRMARTTLRYAIERFEESERKYWLNRKPE